MNRSRTMEANKSKKIIALCAFLSVVAFGTSFYFGKQQAQIDKEYHAKNEQLVQKKDELRNLPNTINKKLLKNNDSSSAQQLKQSNQVVEKGKMLFSQLYKINSDMSDNEWKNRRSYLKRFATESALLTTGLNYEEQGINRTYDTKIKVKKIKVNTGLTENNELDGIVQITYDQNTNLSDDTDRIVALYQFLYNFNTQKFTTLVPVGQLSSEQI